MKPHPITMSQGKSDKLDTMLASGEWARNERRFHIALDALRSCDPEGYRDWLAENGIFPLWQSFMDSGEITRIVTAMQQRTMDLFCEDAGHRFIVSGGEVLEIDS